MVAVKNDMSYEGLTRQFKDRQIDKRYLALVYGKMKVSDGVIRLPIGRHPTNRKKMSSKGPQGRSTETLWRVKEAFQGVTLLEVDLKTGRTHQVRVHCAAMGHPVVGDATYGGKRRWKELPSQDVQDVLRHVRRQMLHARRLAFKHPRTGQWMRFESPLPKDMGSVLAFLRGLDSRQP
jgi:23S rRNA pseudouridine1911/1915/1917 synthase